MQKEKYKKWEKTKEEEMWRKVINIEIFPIKSLSDCVWLSKVRGGVMTDAIRDGIEKKAEL